LDPKGLGAFSPAAKKTCGLRFASESEGTRYIFRLRRKKPATCASRVNPKELGAFFTFGEKSKLPPVFALVKKREGTPRSPLRGEKEE